jgi:hypothetical protein
MLKMLTTLPQDIILKIASYIDREYISRDYEYMEDIGIDCKNMKKLFEYFNYKDGSYYPLSCLYATCKSFQWLNKLEYICIESGDFHNNIVTKNIYGVYHGMLYNIQDVIIGYGYYNNGKMIRENIFCTDTHYFYRIIDGVRIKLNDCNLWNKCNCNHCISIKIIEKCVYTKDIYFKNIIENNYNNGKVFIREKNENILQYYFLQ